MRIAKLVPRVSSTSPSANRNRKRVRIVALIALVAVVAAGAIASASSAQLRALIFGAWANGGSVPATKLSASETMLAQQNKSNATLAAVTSVSESQLNKAR